MSKPFTVWGNNKFTESVTVYGEGQHPAEGFSFEKNKDVVVDIQSRVRRFRVELKNTDKATGPAISFEQGGNKLIVDRTNLNVDFKQLEHVVKPGQKITTSRSSEPVRGKPARFSLTSSFPGASVDSKTGVLTYEPPAEFGGGYVEIDVKATYDKETLGDKYISGEPHIATATFRFYVEPQPQSDLHVTVKDNKDGTYTLSKNDGSAPVTIKTKDGVQSVSQSGNTITFTMADGTKKTVKVTPDSPVTITDNKDGTATISDGKTSVTVPTEDLRVTDVKKDKDGNYVVTRNDGEKWTINLKELRDKIGALEKKNSPTRDEFDKLAGELKEAKDGIDGLKGKDAKIDEAIQELKNGLDGLDGRVSKLEGRVTDVENATIKEVVKNPDGTYTLIRKDGSKVKGNIGDPKEIKDVTANPDGSITITRVNGTEDKVKLAHTKVTEANKGTPDHTVTIAVPGGKPLTFNVFDRHVNNVAKQGRGKYVVSRNDGKKWSIDYSDLYTTADDLSKKVANHEKRIEALESNDKVQDQKIKDLRADVDKHTKELERVNTEIREITKTIETNNSNSDEKFKEVNKRIDKVRTDLSLLDVRVISLEGRMALVEGRLDVVEDVQDKWAKCYSGTGIAALPIALSIPLYVLSQTHIPQVEALNADIQKRIGIFNPELAAMWRQNGGILQVTAALAGLAGTIGAIAYAANECKPYSETDAASQTPLGQMSSKVYAGSSRNESAEESATPAQ